MGRWAQARKRGSPHPPGSEALAAPVFNTDFTWQWLSEGIQFEVTEPDVELPLPKVGLKVELALDFGPWEPLGNLQPGNSLESPAIDEYSVVQIRAAWMDGTEARISDWSNVVYVVNV